MYSASFPLLKQHKYVCMYSMFVWVAAVSRFSLLTKPGLIQDAKYAYCLRLSETSVRLHDNANFAGFITFAGLINRISLFPFWHLRLIISVDCRNYAGSPWATLWINEMSLGEKQFFFLNKVQTWPHKSSSKFSSDVPDACV